MLNARSVRVGLALLALALADGARAREVLRYTPPAGHLGGYATVTLTTDLGTTTVVANATLSSGDVRVRLGLNPAQTIVEARVDVTNAMGAVVATYSGGAAWPTTIANVALAWTANDGSSLHDQTTADLHDQTTADFHDQTTADIVVANDNGARVMKLACDDSGTLTASAYAALTGTVPIGSTQNVSAPDQITAVRASLTGQVTVSGRSFTSQTGSVSAGSTVTLVYYRGDGSSLAGHFEVH